MLRKSSSASVVVSRAAWVGRVPNGSLAEDGGLFVFTLQSGRGRREKVNANVSQVKMKTVMKPSLDPNLVDNGGCMLKIHCCAVFL